MLKVCLKMRLKYPALRIIKGGGHSHTHEPAGLTLCQICDTHYHNWSNFALWSLWCRVLAKSASAFRSAFARWYEIISSSSTCKRAFFHTHTCARSQTNAISHTAAIPYTFPLFLSLGADVDDARVICASAVGNWLGASCWLDATAVSDRGATSVSVR